MKDSGPRMLARQKSGDSIEREESLQFVSARKRNPHPALCDQEFVKSPGVPLLTWVCQFLQPVERLLAWLFVFLIERFVSINQIRTGLPTLAFPKSISLLICSKNQHTSLGNAFGFQGFARSIRQKLTNTLLLVIRVDKGVIDV